MQEGAWSFIPFVTLSMMIISLLSCWWWSSYLCYLVDDDDKWWCLCWKKRDFPNQRHTAPEWKSNTSKKMNSLGGCLPNLDSKTTLTFFGTYNASSALTFAKSRQCLRISVQRVEKHLNPVPNWPSTVLRRMMRRNVTNVEICSKRQTLQGILRFIQAEVVCWHVKNVERLSRERTLFANMWTDSMKKLQSTNVVTARKLFLKNGTWRSTWLFTQELHGSSANTVRRISHLNLICIVMWRNATQPPRY